MSLVISPAGRRYGRHIPKPLPPHRMLKRGWQPTYPPYVDLRKFCGPVKNQGSEGFCTANAGASIDEWINRAYLKRQPILSAQFLYVRELLAQGNFPNDDGSDGDTLCRVLCWKGCCEESLYPSIPGEILMTTLEQEENARNYELGAYHGLADSTTAVSVLADPTPWPFAIGFPVYSSFESEQTAKTGVMPIPGPNEELMGGHEVGGYGYDIGEVPYLRPSGCPAAILCLNSWSEQWGDQGFFWMPIPILDRPDVDMRIVHHGFPWK
jgi:hypothetical protein